MKGILRLSIIACSLLVSKNSFPLQMGVNVHPNQFPGTTNDIVEILNTNHIKSFRTDYSWGQLEKKTGVFSPQDDKTNDLINKSRSAGLKPLLILDYGNSIYNIERPITTDEVNKYVQYVSWVVNHFKGKVYAYEIWNEWIHRDNLNDKEESYQSASNYYSLVKAVSTVIRQHDPSVKIIAGGYNPTDPKAREWGDMIVDKGILNYIDGISIHPYDYSSPDKTNKIETFSIIDKQYNQWKNKTGKVTKIYITEFGYSTYDGKFHYTEQQVKDTLSLYFAEAKKYSYIDGIWYYELIDKSRNRNDIESNYGLLNSSESPKVQMKSFLQ